LRTPSISSPQADNTGSFPWEQALHATPQKQERQLSVIPDEGEMFPEATTTWRSADPEASSISSAWDSGVGTSYKSSNISSVAITVPVSSSLPITGSRAMASVYGAFKDNFAKSWSDLWEEEEEEMQQRLSLDSADDIERVSTAKPSETHSTPRCFTPALDIKGPSRCASGRRSALSQLKDANSRSNSPESFRSRFTSQVKQMAASVPSKPSGPKRSGSFLMDKWAALGNLRRGSKTDASSTPVKHGADPDQFKHTPARRESFMEHSKHTPAASTQRPKPRDRSGSWRKDASKPQPIINELWNISKDWRSPKQPNYTHASGGISSTALWSPSTGASNSYSMHHDADIDDVGDLEWVGGWEVENLHL